MFLMTNATSVASSAPGLSFFTHDHKKVSHPGGAGASAAGRGATSTQGLLSNLMQSIEQVIGISVTAAATATATAPTVATGTVAGTAATASAGVTGPATVTAAGAVPEVHDFMHSLLYALRSDGLGRGPDDARAILAGDAARGAGKYGSLTSSLQTLIQQVSADAPATAASSDLTASLDKLVQGLNTNATAGAGSSAMAQVSLPGLLSRLLQNVQVGGTQSVRAVGANVNANV